MEIKGLSKKIGDFHLHDIDLDIKEGEYFIILGPTGAGKTILLETIAGIHSPDTGSIMIGGSDITGTDPKLRGVGMVYQDYMLFPHLNVEENIGFGLKQRNADPGEIHEKVAEAAGMLRIDHLLGRLPETLSGGEQQRAAIARALIIEPEILLLDEPLSALDVTTRERLRHELKNIHQTLKTTILHITHHFEDIYSLADRVAVMQNGTVVQTGTPGDIFRRPATGFVASFTGMENIFRGRAEQKDGMTEIDLGSYRLSADASAEGDVYAGIRPEDICIRKENRIEEPLPANTLKGTITEIQPNGMLFRVLVDTGIPIVCQLTQKYIIRSGLEKGDEVTLTLNPSAIHLFPVEKDDDFCHHPGGSCKTNDCDPEKGCSKCSGFPLQGINTEPKGKERCRCPCHDRD